jgi:hypothetical protein
MKIVPTLERMRHKRSGKYVVRTPIGYPASVGELKYAYEHRVVWWLHYGTLPPKGYHIHHINSDPFDNRIENLQALSQSDHTTIHMREMWGSLNSELTCTQCNKVFERRNLYIRHNAKGPSHKPFCSRRCVVTHLAIVRTEANNVNLSCPSCNNEFGMPRYMVELRKKRGQLRIFCSKSCSTTFYNKNRHSLRNQ